MRLFSLLVALMIGATAHAATPTAASEAVFNRLQGMPAASAYSLGTMIREAHNTLVCKYDFAVQGGALGDLSLRQADNKTLCKLPSKAIVQDGLIDVVTAITANTGATIALKLQTAADIKGATAYASFTGQMDTVPVSTAATAIKLTAERTLVATVAVSTLTAGKFRVFLDYVLSE